MRIKNGKVYIVGAGPGDPELISVKGLKALKKANCVLYDFLSSPALLKYVRSGAKKICVGKTDGLHLKEQNEINKLLHENSRKYRYVVRLKGGDPAVFSRGFEEMRYLSERGVRTEVIPGITSAIAGPESFGIPLTVKNKIQSFAVLTGRKEDPNAGIDAPDCPTLVYLMGVANIRNIVKALRKSRRSGTTPCAFIERATTRKARIVKATINTIVKEAAKQRVKPPAVLIVGEVVNYAKA
ncbi:MAG: uroporphyrinogen-III C-methyltransferase [Candidatus Omnitrophota bacterium]|nr:uroporphyrinogen-III C-methyltransferase [Candidatus Omnitrophota bacterium]